eukprot:3849893-Alexandrium_andersonii.AAC.1
MSTRASTHLPLRSRRRSAGMTTSARASYPAAAANALRQAPAMPACALAAAAPALHARRWWPR